jgi:predicted lipid-binding transport protein (Tim44 family)
MTPRRHRRRHGRRRTTLLIVLTIVVGALALAPVALAGAGGGSAGFSGGGGGGGGGSGFALYVVFQLLFRIALIGHGLGALFLLACALLYAGYRYGIPYLQEWMATRAAARRTTGHHRPSKRERKVELAAAEAAEEDPELAPDRVRTTARNLFFEIEKAWDADDRIHLRGLVAPDLLDEWERRLDDLRARGWRNRVEPIGDPVIEYVGLRHTGDRDTDRVVVRIDARMRDYVIDRQGRHLKRTGSVSEITRLREFWTLQRRAEHWVLASIEQGSEGKHALQDEVVATAYADDTGMRDESLIEGAVADAVPEGTKIAEVADLTYEGDAQSAANDLSLADGRFASAVLEVAARRAVNAWALAIDGNDALLDPIATPAAKRELLYAGDTSGAVRLVVRGPVVKRIRIESVDAAVEPATMTIEVDLTGTRYVENRDTTAVVAGSRTRSTSFTERWTFSLTDDPAQPWRITGVGAPVGLT